MLEQQSDGLIVLSSYCALQEHENPGYILVSLCYNKEDDKLTVIAMRGKLLKCAAHEDTLLQETLSKRN